MYDLPQFFRYSGLTALGLALAATGLPATASAAEAQPTTVLTSVSASGVIAERPPRDGETRRGQRADRSEARQERRANRSETRQNNRAERRQNRQNNRADRRQNRQDNRVDRRQNRQDNRANRQAQQQRGDGSQAAWDARLRAREAYRAQQRQENRYDRREARRDQRQEARREARRDQRRAERRADRREARRDYRRWNRTWRNNNRYNWRQYRAQNRRHYNIGRYYAPYRNYSYRRLSIGFTLGSLFFGNRYWINDPWSYRLPQVYGPYKWVRYYDDVLLVNTYSGEVVDVIYDFFW